MDTLPLFTVLLLALLLTLAGSRFIYAPGLLASLEDETAAGTVTGGAIATTGATTGAAPAPVLPRSTSPALAGVATQATLVLTTRADMAFFDGRRYRIEGDELAKALAAAAGRWPVLLLKLDRTVTVDRLVRLLDIARDAGFRQVNFAAEDARSAPAPASR